MVNSEEMGRDIIKIGINGFEGIGCVVAIVVALGRGGVVEIVAINDAVHTPEYMVCMLKKQFNYPDEVKLKDEKTILFAGKPITVFNYRDNEEIPWATIGVDYVVDATGRFTDKDKAKAHLKGGAKKVIIAAPSKDAPTFVYGVNHLEYTSNLDIVSNASAIANCVTPIAKVIHNRFDIAACDLTVLHSTSGTQNTVWKFNDPASFRHILPSTGEGTDIEQVIPALKGKLTLKVLDLPASDVFSVFITVTLDKSATYDQIKEVILEESEGDLKGILSFANKGVQATDVVGRSCIFDANAGVAHSDKFVKLVAQHDGNWGYCNRMVDLIEHMASSARE